MLESVIQLKIIKDLESKGWFVRKIIQTNHPGDPDLYCFKNGRTVWIECKRPGKNPEPLQIFRGKEIIKFGMEWFWCDSFENYLKLNI